MAAETAIPERSYGCSFGDGNPYDYVFIDVRSGETLFPCLPCFVRLAADIVSAVTTPSEEQMATWLEGAQPAEAAPITSGGHKPGRRNAPVNTDDPELFGAFDAVITADELPPEFR
jgi:hypothetical protein